MAKNDPAEQDVTLNMAQLVELVQSMAKAQMLDAEAISTIAAKAATTASETLKDQWWNEAKYPNISAFNPAGEKAHPRPELKGDVYWAGYLLRGDELTKEEIDLLNQVQPGSYRMRDRGGNDQPFIVRDLDPTVRGSRRLLILFPCTDTDQRHNLPTMVEMLTQVLQPVAA